jgi:hypothetical protein
MTTLAEAERLGALHTTSPSVLSLYVAVPLVPAELRSMPARADDLMAAAEGAVDGAWHVAEEDRSSVRERLQAGGRDWLGHSMAMFACADARLFEAVPLPRPVPDQAVLGIRPHIRPLLAALRRCPAYRVVVVDRVHARLFHVADNKTEATTTTAAASIRGAGSGGWHGFESYRTQRRASQFAYRHYQDTAAMVEKAMADGEPQPLVIGGHDESVSRLLDCLPASKREWFAGSFGADVHTVTAARVRELAAPHVARWASQRDEQLAREVLARPPGSLTATGLRACLDAVNARAVRTLIVPGDGLVPGWECGRCGRLSVDAGPCPDCEAAALPVPDVIEEMVAKTLQDGGQVCPVHDPLSRIAARLRFPVAAREAAADNRSRSPGTR